MVSEDETNRFSLVSGTDEVKLLHILQAYEELGVRVKRQSALTIFSLLITVLFIVLAQVGVLQEMLGMTAIGAIFALSFFFLVVSIVGLISVSRQTVSSVSSPSEVMRTIEQELADDCSRTLQDMVEAQTALHQALQQTDDANASIPLEALRASMQKFSSHLSKVCAIMGDRHRKQT